jgi:aspartyl protease family protein
MSLGYHDPAEGRAAPGEDAGADGIGRQAPLRPPRRILHRLALLASGGLVLWLGLGAVYAPRSWHASDDFWLLLLLATGAFALVAMAAPRSRLAAVGGRMAPWLGVVVLVALGYGYRHEIGELAGRWRASTGESLAFTASPDTFYRIDATVDGAKLRFLVDTGSTDIMLTSADATRLGLDLGRLEFSEGAMTPNGMMAAAAVTLNEIAVGPIVMHDVPAFVTRGEQEESLLGMRFLANVARITIQGGVLTIRQ